MCFLPAPRLSVPAVTSGGFWVAEVESWRDTWEVDSKVPRARRSTVSRDPACHGIGDRGPTAWTGRRVLRHPAGTAGILRPLAWHSGSALSSPDSAVYSRVTSARFLCVSVPQFPYLSNGDKSPHLKVFSKMTKPRA